MNEKTLETMKFIRGTLMWFLVFYLGFWAYQTYVNPPAETAATEATVQAVTITPLTDSVTEGNLIAWNISGEKADVVAACEAGFSLSRRVNGTAVDLGSGTPCEACNTFCEEVNQLPDGPVQKAFSASAWQAAAVTEPGTYGLAMGDYTAAPVEVTEAGTLRKLFRSLITQPLFNVLVWLTNALPGRSLGWAIVLLTVMVRLLLFIPNQRALRSQKKMQAIQPRLQEIQKKHKDNQQMLAMKTMELYKQHGVNPMSSCLPLLLQMPFLLGVYYIVQDGIAPHLADLLYSFQSGASLSGYSAGFFGLDVTKRNLFPLPFLVAGAQFFALRWSMQRAKANATAAPQGEQMQQMQKVMQYAMPLMIGGFTATLAAGVGVYWLTSTLFGIGQQQLIQHQLNTPEAVVKG